MKNPEPATAGTLDPEMLLDLVRYREFLAARDRALDVLLRQHLPPTRLRDEIIRSVLIEFGHGRRNRLSFYQRELTAFAGRFAIRDEVHRLSDLGVLVLENDPSDRRALVVSPSRILVDWCADYAQILRNEIRSLFRATSSGGRNG